jgi:hypothetical protein
VAAVSGHLATEEGIYGVILVAGLIVVSGMEVLHALTAFVTVVSTVLVFWIAHVYAGAIAYRAPDGAAGVGASLAHSLRESLGLLVAALIPALILLLGVTHAVPDDVAIWIALWVCVADLAVLGYLAFRRRGSRVAVCLLGALTTAALGMLMVLLKVLLH